MTTKFCHETKLYNMSSERGSLLVITRMISYYSLSGGMAGYNGRLMVRQQHKITRGQAVSKNSNNILAPFFPHINCLCWKEDSLHD